MREEGQTSLSASPCHLEVRVVAEMLKKVALDSCARALARRVFPLPGGPYSRRPLAGLLSPLKRSARRAGSITISCKACRRILVNLTHEAGTEFSSQRTGSSGNTQAWTERAANRKFAHPRWSHALGFSWCAPMHFHRMLSF